MRIRSLNRLNALYALDAWTGSTNFALKFEDAHKSKAKKQKNSQNSE